MSIEENLTYLQKTAIKGEIAFALSTAAHNAEIKFRTFLILKEVEDKYKPFIIECIKEAITFDETVIDRIYLEVVNNDVPVWLWIEEIIADIKLHISMADAGLAGITGNRLSINKVQERKNIIESAFVMFAREALILSPNASEQLLDEIINDYDLEFLHSACFYLKSSLPEIRTIKGNTADDIPEELMSCLFDVKRMMSFAVESKALKMLNRAEKKEGRYRKITKQPLPTELNGEVIAQGSFTIDNTITHEELSQYISEKIAELFDGTPTIRTSPAPKPSNTVYVVKKVFTDSGISTNIRVCRTEQEAADFVKKIEREYPELARTCEFQVERVNDKEKNQWQSKKT
jgi:hypothetical protein